MNSEKSGNRVLLERVQRKLLKQALNDTDPNETSLTEAIKVTEKIIEFEKLDASYIQASDKLQSEKEINAIRLETEDKINRTKLETEVYINESKLKAELDINQKKIDADDRLSKKEAKRNLFKDLIVLGVVPLVIIGVKFALGRSNQKLIGKIENYETPVTTPGKSQHRNMIDDYKI